MKTATLALSLLCAAAPLLGWTLLFGCGLVRLETGPEPWEEWE